MPDIQLFTADEAAFLATVGAILAWHFLEFVVVEKSGSRRCEDDQNGGAE